jgi:hypothetical protein
MKKTILTYGLISSAVIVVMMTLTTTFSQQIGFDNGYIIGYTTIILSLSFIFFGIKSYRDRVGNGPITFGKAFLIGIMIALISSACYVIAWLIIYYNFMPDYMHQYANHIVEKMKVAGASQQAIDQKITEMNKFEERFQNPFFNAAMTFIEPFPVGVVIALISALVLKRKNS